jgi:hypothetical protein
MVIVEKMVSNSEKKKKKSEWELLPVTRMIRVLCDGPVWWTRQLVGGGKRDSNGERGKGTGHEVHSHSLNSPHRGHVSSLSLAFYLLSIDWLVSLNQLLDSFFLDPLVRITLLFSFHLPVAYPIFRSEE